MARARLPDLVFGWHTGRLVGQLSGRSVCAWGLLRSAREGLRAPEGRRMGSHDACDGPRRGVHWWGRVHRGGPRRRWPGGCRRLPYRLGAVTNAREAGACRQGDSGWAQDLRFGSARSPAPD